MVFVNLIKHRFKKRDTGSIQRGPLSGLHVLQSRVQDERKGTSDFIVFVREGPASKKPKIDFPSDFVQWVDTTDIRCFGGCDFFGGRGGFCSRCWDSLSKEDKIRHSEEQKVLEVQRTHEREERLRQEKEETERAEKEKLEKREQNERELAEKMGRGECYKIGCLTDDVSADQWGNGVCPYI